MEKKRDFALPRPERGEIEKELRCPETGELVAAWAIWSDGGYWNVHPEAALISRYRNWFRDFLGNDGEFSETYVCPHCGKKFTVGDYKMSRRFDLVAHHK